MKHTYYKMIMVFCVVILTGITGADLFAAQAPPYSGDLQHTQTPQWPDVKADGQITLYNLQDWKKSAYLPPLPSYPDPPAAGVQYQIWAYVRYSGFPDGGPYPFFVRIEVDNFFFEEIEDVAYGPSHGLTSVKTSKLWKATPGTHTIKYIVDCKNNIAEGPINAGNNSHSETFNVPFPRLDIKPPIEKNINPAIPRAR
jgi:hypothetical protein